jgi:S-formylglutathione hydrolase FrmB
MAFVELKWKSELLGRETITRVLVPEVGAPPYATLYLLHPLNEDSSYWLTKTKLETLVRDLPLLVVMPNGDRGFYTDHEKGPPYARYIGEEVVDLIDRAYPTRSERSGRAIGGVSMGGYGALRVGLGYSDRFCSIHSHGGSLDRDVEFKLNPAERIGIMKTRPDSFILEMRRVFGERPRGTKHDVLRLAIEASQRGSLPRLWIDCGVDDYLISGTRALHRELVAADIPHMYHEVSGGHASGYTTEQFDTALKFHVTNLGLTATSPGFQ